MKRFLMTGAILSGVGLGVVSRADWPNFLGPRHDGISQETGLKVNWSEPIPQIWEKPIGAGFSSFAAVGNRLFTGGTENGRQVLLAMDAITGDIIWRFDIEEEYKEPVGGDGPRATPTVHDGMVYMLGARGRLVCVNAEDGKLVWATQFSHMPQWGYSGSVLVEGDLAYSSGGSSDGALVALDRKTGNPVWKTGDDPAGYSTPYPFTFEGTRYIVGFTGTSAIVVDAKSGKLAWRQPWKTDWDVNAAAPIFHDGHLFLTSGYDTGAGLFKLRKEGDGLAGTEVWQSKVLLNKFQSCILHQGALYASDQKGLACVDFMTGKEHWRKRRVANGTMVLAESNLFLLTEKGELQIAPASTEDFVPRSKSQIMDGRCWTVPVLHQGKLYARNLERAACFALK